MNGIAKRFSVCRHINPRMRILSHIAYLHTWDHNREVALAEHFNLRLSAYLIREFYVGMKSPARLDI